jgi:hypothetical protein
MNPKQMLLILTTLLGALVAALAGLALQAPAAQAATTDKDVAAVNVLYLPIVSRSPSAIFGQVKEGGANAAGVPVSLRFYNGAAWSTQATVNTDANGRFRFNDPTGLTGTQRYQVTFDNTTGNDNRLAWWGTRHLTSYAAGTDIHIGDFDIAAVHLGQPAHQATVGLPATFGWTRRPATATDSYALRLYDSTDLNPLYVSPYVGYGSSFQLNSLPGGFNHATAYTWDVILLAPDGATGVSRQARSVRFNGGIFGRVLQNGAAVGAVPLQLRFFNGSSWSTIASTTTAADGTYAFTSAPTLGAGQKYYVRYQNVTQTAGRLFLWSTRSLTAYTAGTAVDMSSFDIADVALVSPSAGASVGLPVQFQWTRRTATTNDGYIVEIYDPSDYQPRWLSPLLGYADHFDLGGLAAALNTFTPYAWDLIITSPDGGSGVSRMARLVQFTNRGSGLVGEESADWPFEEELPERPPEDIEGEPIDAAPDEAEAEVEPETEDGADSVNETGDNGETDETAEGETEVTEDAGEPIIDGEE